MTHTEIVEAWLAELPDPATWELVRPGFWYVRIPGEKRRWIPIELSLGPRTLKAVSHVIPDPIENREEVYRFLLRHNHSATGVAFSYDGTEGVLCLVGRISRSELGPDSLDAIAGAIVDITERTFRSILHLGFGSLLKR
jgi:hypothetical protein